MIIRDFQLPDLDGVLTIEYDVFNDPYPPGIIVELFNKGAGFLVAEFCERIVGYVIFWIKESVGHIIIIAVDKNYQNMQIGSALLKKAIAIFYRNKIYKIRLEVRKSNEMAIHFYQKNGFIKIATEDNYYADGESAIIMQYSKYY